MRTFAICSKLRMSSASSRRLVAFDVDSRQRPLRVERTDIIVVSVDKQQRQVATARDLLYHLLPVRTHLQHRIHK